MTTPENEDAPTTETPMTPVVDNDALAPPPPAAAQQPPPLQPPWVAPPGAMAGPGGMWVGPPRQRWINPQKRTAAILLAIGAALVLLVVGGVIGAELNNGHDRRGPARFGPVYGYPGQGGQFRGPRDGQRVPNRPNLPNLPNLPSRTPSASSTS